MTIPVDATTTTAWPGQRPGHLYISASSNGEPVWILLPVSHEPVCTNRCQHGYKAGIGCPGCGYNA